MLFTHDICQKIIDDGFEPYVKQRTGLVSATYFSGPKLKWILDNLPGARAHAERGEVLFGTVDTWLIWWLTGGAGGGGGGAPRAPPPPPAPGGRPPPGRGGGGAAPPGDS